MTNSAEPMLLSQHFDSAGMDAEQAFDGWKQAIAPVFDLAPVDEQASFAASYDTFHLGEVLVGLGTFDPTVFMRTRRKVQADGIDHVLVQVYTRGGYTGLFDDQTITVRRGDLVTLDLAREVRTRSATSTNITVMIPRTLIKAHDIPHGHMAQDGGSAVVSRLMADYLVALRRRLPTLPRASANAVGEATVALYNAALASRSEAGAASSDVRREALFQRARRLIDERLASGDLDADALASALAISRSALYRLFEPHRGVANYVLDRRLAFARRALCDPADSRRVGAIAADVGFVDASHFSRAFRKRFGTTPAEMRRQGAIAGLAPEAGAEFDLRPWIKDIS